MPKSLRCKIKKLCYNDTLTEKERDRILKALDQEDVLDKIKAEIIGLRSGQNVGVLECLDIIDKYITESEDAE
jgi:hypothetical protein